MQTVYLDTANWMDLANGVVDNSLFYKLLRSGDISPVMSFVHLLELANTSEDNRKLYGGFVDDVNATCPMKWIHNNSTLIRMEFNNLLCEMNGMTPPKQSPFAERLFDVLRVRMPRYAELDLRNLTTYRKLNAIRATEEFSYHIALRQVVLKVRTRITDSRKGFLEFSKQEIDRWVLDLMPTDFEDNRGFRVSTTQDIRSHFLMHYRLEQIPTLNLRIRFHEASNMMIGKMLLPSYFVQRLTA